MVHCPVVMFSIENALCMFVPALDYRQLSVLQNNNKNQLVYLHAAAPVSMRKALGYTGAKQEQGLMNILQYSVMDTEAMEAKRTRPSITNAAGQQIRNELLTYSKLETEAMGGHRQNIHF